MLVGNLGNTALAPASSAALVGVGRAVKDVLSQPETERSSERERERREKREEREREKREERERVCV